MAQKRKKRKAKKIVRFQLTVGGVIGIGVVSFCIFMWMFFLGIWAGQTILLPSASLVKKTKMTKGYSDNKNPPFQRLTPERKKKKVM